MFADRLAERASLLGVLDRFFERGARDAKPSRRDVDALAFETSHYVLETFAFATADQVCGGHAEVFKQQLACFEALVTELVDITAHGNARTFLSDKCADSSICRFCISVRLHHYQHQLSASRVSDPHLRAVYVIVVAPSLGGRSNSLKVSAGVRLG